MPKTFGKRVFIKHYGQVIETFAGAANEELNNIIMTAEEDIRVIGVQIDNKCIVVSGNDGHTYCAAEVSQTGRLAGDGIIVETWAHELWNTSPAAVMMCDGREVVMFPEGHYVPVMEGGSLYLNTWTWGKSAGISKYSVVTKIFYVK